MQHSHQLVYGLQKANRLNSYVTSLFYKHRTPPYSWLSQIERVHTFMRKRSFEPLDQSKIHNILALEVFEQLSRRLLGHSQLTENMMSHKAHIFDYLVSKCYINHHARILISYPDCALHSFKAIKKKGGIAIMDMPIQHHSYTQKLFEEEKELAPEFAKSLIVVGSENPERLDEELYEADYIVIPSDFVRWGFEQFGFGKKLVKINYGTHIPPATPAEISTYTKGQPIKLIYVGQITQRKGIKYALEAIRILKKRNIPVELTLVGKIYDCAEAIEPYHDCFNLVPFMSRDKLRPLLLSQHVFLLPSLIEGSSLALIEGIATGLVPIVTDHTGAEAVTPANGFVLPIRNPEAIANAVQQLYENPDQLNQMKLKSLEAIQAFTWDNYHHNWQKFLTDYNL